ncbi:MAG: bifunctional (p)ppGpp synthetase/guanosine-3',5'-bis(diphosphate) 3'-pyrophosphohydrolase [Oscillospiraceae bacterium]|nr:bifunctional (p)ppGpp synthetase/guanosine-3',5'-bis(diphosphate) 3'-pyrophosphohydrolase [Oscillospiraceae bacterium]
MDTNSKKYNDDYTIAMLISQISETNKNYDVSKIVKAYEVAEKAHEGQKRSSGQPYIIHPLAVAKLIVELGLDTDTVCAGLLHDVVEDTEMTTADIKKLFGQDVAILVDGVTNLTNMHHYYNKQQQDAADVRRVVFATAKDIRIIIIKLCDRLHNIRTLCYREPQKRWNKSYETLHIYAPIAHRLGMKNMQNELETLCIQYLDPVACDDIKTSFDNEMSEEKRNEFIEMIKSRISGRLEKEFKGDFELQGRIKSLYGMYKKMFQQSKIFEQIYDRYAVRVLVPEYLDCYTVLGVINDMFTPMPNRFKDYISFPKSNGYQSIQTTVIGEEGIPFEIQIRTYEMHKIAEYGVAAHWKYKEGVKSNYKLDNYLKWVSDIIETQKTSHDVEELARVIKEELQPDEIVVMTPKGRAIVLPQGSNVIDFAYKIHTEIGHKTTGAKVDSKIVPLDYELKTGEMCEIITSKDENKGPNRAWMNIVKTSEAKSKIRTWFKRECREENIATGKLELEREFKRYRINIPENKREEFLSDDFKRHNCTNLEDFYASIGYGGTNLSKIIPRLQDKYNTLYNTEPAKKEIIEPSKAKGIIVDAIDDCVTKFAQCCNPLPGDDIIGYITRGYGITVHNINCSNYKSALERNNPDEIARWCDVKWPEDISTKTIQTSIEVVAIDRVGLVRDISSVLADAHIPIVHSSSRNLKNGNALFEANLEIAGKEQLKNLFDKLRKIKDVISVERASS